MFDNKYNDFMMFYGDHCDDPRDPIERKLAVMKTGRNVAFGKSAPSPDKGMIASAQASKEVGLEQVKLARESLDFYKKQYQEYKPVINQIMQSEVSTQQANKDRADEYADYERSTFRPLEQKLISEAEKYDTESKREELTRQGMADVGQAFGNAREQQNRQLAAAGLRPNSGRFASLNQQLNVQEALAKAGIANNARTMANDKKTAMMYDAAGLGRGLATNASTAYGVGLQAGQGARQSAQTGGEMMGQGYRTAGNLYGGATNSYGTAGNIYGQEFNARMQGYNAQQEMIGGFAKGIGSIAGMARSSKDYKENKKPIKKGSALKALRNLDVEEWDYKPGYADGGHHVGPYAEDFKRETGAGNGKMIAHQDAIGLTMKAVQDLAADVDKLKQQKKPVKKAGGGMVRGPGGPVDDKIPAMLSNGEYVLPADTVKAIGTHKLDKLVKDTHTPAAVQRKRKALKGKR